MITLGVECTAHTLGVGIVENGKILSNVHDIYRPVNEGIIPRKAADHHADVFVQVLDDNLEKAKVGIEDIDLISFSQGPGIGAPLAVGIFGAKYLAARFGKKIMGVNHCYAHIKISENLCKLKNALVLYVSGGNTQILVNEKGSAHFYHVLGETLDIGIGNLFDSFGRAIGLEYAHGSTLAALAEKGKYVELPYTVKGMNLVFSGLLTHAEKLYTKGGKKEDLCHSLMETAFAMICEATERALFLTGKKGIIACGGVAQNRRLREMLGIMCSDDNVKLGIAPDEFNRDNGAMIAYAGEVLYRRFGTRPPDYWKPITNYRIDRMKEVFGWQK